MADNTAQQPEDVPFDKDFNAEDADIVVQSTATSTIKGLRFKVHRKNLASASSVLAGMLEVPLSESANTPAPPVVQLSEDSDVIRVILAMACNKAEGLQFKGDTDWRFIWRVWEAACKYEMFGLRAYAQMALLYVYLYTQHIRELLIQYDATCSQCSK